MRGSIRSAATGLALCVETLAPVAFWSEAALAQTAATRTSSFAYNANTGLLTQEVIEPDTPALRLQTDYTYNAFGHKVTVTADGADIDTRTATFDAKGQFPASAKNALNHAERWKYDERFGSPSEHTGPNGLTSKWSYDGFGRKTQELRADGTRTTWSYVFCAGTADGKASCPAGAKHLVEVKALDPDGTTKIGQPDHHHPHVDPVPRPARPRYRREARYDALGRVEKKSRPYFVSGGTPEWTTFTYDALDRVVTATEPNTAVTSQTYHGLTTSVTNAAGADELAVEAPEFSTWKPM
jgi:YD repeat-containing protein